MSKYGYELLISSQSDGAPNTAGTAASMLPPQAKYTLPAGSISAAGTVLRIKAFGRISSLITTPGTARFDVRFGSNVVFDGLAILLDSVAAHTNVAWALEIDMICRAVGSSTSATVFGVGKWTSEDILGVPATAPKGSLTAVLPWNAAPAVGAGFDSTVANVIDVFFTQTAATGSMTCHGYILESPGLEDGTRPRRWGGRRPA